MEKIEYDLDPLDISVDDGDQSEMLIDEKSGAKNQLSEDCTQFELKNSKGVMYKLVHLQQEHEPLLTATNLNTTNAEVQPCGFYVITNNQTNDYVQTTHRNITPKSELSTIKAEPMPSNIKMRDEKRRATHNEVERRRRDKINNWIMKINSILPDSVDGNNGSFESLSKGGILAKAYEYIKDLKESNHSFSECLKDNEKIGLENTKLLETNDRLRRDNELLRAQIAQHGIVPAPDTDS